MNLRPLLALGFALSVSGSALAQSRAPFTIAESGQTFSSLQEIGRAHV